MHGKSLLKTGVSLLALLVLAGAVFTVTATADSTGNLLRNGNFEEGFTSVPGCGEVANGWGCFTNDGAADYHFGNDMWAPVVQEGQRSQLIVVSTKHKGGEHDRFAGIYQTVDVEPGKTYSLDLYGLIRSDETGALSAPVSYFCGVQSRWHYSPLYYEAYYVCYDGECYPIYMEIPGVYALTSESVPQICVSQPDSWRYVVEWGIDPFGGTDWRAVPQWYPLPWNRYDPVLNPGSFQHAQVTIRPLTPRITLFLRLRMKWGAWFQEVMVNLDNIALREVTSAP